jgi:hypothetical protein
MFTDYAALNALAMLFKVLPRAFDNFRTAITPPIAITPVIDTYSTRSCREFSAYQLTALSTFQTVNEYRDCPLQYSLEFRLSFGAFKLEGAAYGNADV